MLRSMQKLIFCFSKKNPAVGSFNPSELSADVRDVFPFPFSSCIGGVPAGRLFTSDFCQLHSDPRQSADPVLEPGERS